MALKTRSRESSLTRRPNDIDRAGWLGVAEVVRDYPDYLKYLRKNDKPLYRKVSAGIRSLAIEARSYEWRDEREGVGARPEQLIPGTPMSFSERTDWLVWLLIGGRGSGKSRTGAEAVRELLFGREWVTDTPKVMLVGQTLESVRLDMVENTLLQVLPEGSVITWNRGPCELWVDLGNGKTAFLKGYSSEAARKLRGPNVHLAWCDEIATWTDAKRSPNADSTTWSNMKFAVRLDDGGTWTPRIIATTTPKSVGLIRNVDENDPENPGKGLHDDPNTVISNMSTLDNIENLSSHFFRTVIEPLKGTRLYDQEVMGLLMDEALGAQWSDELVRKMTRPRTWPQHQGRGLKRIVIGVDPSIGAGLGDECGIVVCGMANDGCAYVLEDLSIRAKASVWCQVVAEAFERYGAAAVVVEVNQGGELVEETLGRYAPNLPVVSVFAKVGKQVRAEPVALLSDRDRVRFADEAEAPMFARLQHQMKTWDGEGPSPDRLDAFVYAILYLMPASSGAAQMLTVVQGGTRRQLIGVD